MTNQGVCGSLHLEIYAGLSTMLSVPPPVFGCSGADRRSHPWAYSGLWILGPVLGALDPV